MAKAEVVTLVHFARVQFLFQNPFRKLMGRHHRQISAKRKQQDGIEAGGFEQAEFFGKRRDQLQSGIGPQMRMGWGSNVTAMAFAFCCFARRANSSKT